MSRIAFVLVGALLAAAAQPMTRPAQLVPSADAAPAAGAAAPDISPGRVLEKDPPASGSSTEPLSEKLDRQGGVLHPPAGVDPGLTQAPPAIGSRSMPVIPPPGSTGQGSELRPK